MTRHVGARLWAVVTVVTAIALGVAAGAAAADARARDRRTPVVLPERQRDAVLAEMRGMLSAVRGVLDGIARADTALMRASAGAAGVGDAADLGPDVGDRLPRQFLSLGVATHQAFDDLAGAVAAGAGDHAAVTRLAQLMTFCVSCHETYRLAPPK